MQEHQGLRTSGAVTVRTGSPGLSGGCPALPDNLGTTPSIADRQQLQCPNPVGPVGMAGLGAGRGYVVGVSRARGAQVEDSSLPGGIAGVLSSPSVSRDTGGRAWAALAVLFLVLG
ncbi:hypothetical protein H1C71_041873, partial [Ictidomys tridecemlineatus]